MDKLITQLAEQGTIYLLLAISLLANGYLFNLLLKEKDKRITEAEKVRDSILEPLNTLQTTLNGITVILQSMVTKKV